MGEGQSDPEQRPHRERERIRERVPASCQARHNEHEEQRRRRGVRSRDAPGHGKQPPPRGLDRATQRLGTKPDDDQERHRHRRRACRLEEAGRQQQDEAAFPGVPERRGRQRQGEHRRGGKGDPRRPRGGDAAELRGRLRANGPGSCRHSTPAASHHEPRTEDRASGPRIPVSRFPPGPKTPIESPRPDTRTAEKAANSR